jgi:hypothetical protein
LTGWYRYVYVGMVSCGMPHATREAIEIAKSQGTQIMGKQRGMRGHEG